MSALTDIGGSSRAACARRAYLLLEVVISVALLMLGLSVIGAQLQGGWKSAHRTEEMTRILMLTEAKLAELDTGLVELEEEADDEVEGDFTLRFPHYGWRMRVDETATEGLRMITLQILHHVREDLEDEFEFDEAKVVHTVYALRAEPAKADLQKDYGLDEAAVETIAEALPIQDFDPTAFDITRLSRELPIEDLVELLPALARAFGVSLSDLMGAAPPEMRDLLQEAMDTQEGLSEELSEEMGATSEEGTTSPPPSGGRRGGARDRRPEELKEGRGRP